LTHTGVATDPSADATNWVKISSPVKASQAEAEAGANNLEFMTSLRTAQAIAVLSPGLTTDATTGASQDIDFSSDKIVTSTTSAATVTYSFVNPVDVAKVDLIIDYQGLPFAIVEASIAGSLAQTSEPAPQGLFFKPDGTRLFIIGSNQDAVYPFELSTPWDVSTGTVGTRISVTLIDFNPMDVFFKPDGLKMYILGDTGNKVYQFTLSTAWVVSTATYDSVDFSVASQDTSPQGLFFKPDGTKMFMFGTQNNEIHEYTLSTGWDLSTAAYASASFDPTSQETAPTAVTFRPDGEKVYVVGDGDVVYQYSLPTAWSLSSVTYDNVFSTTVIGSAMGMVFKENGSRLFFITQLNDRVYQYDTIISPTLVFPTLQGPAIPLALKEKTALTIVTTDGGTSYQVISTLGGIV
jgi:sugar lactone lactonase YvrE